MSCYHLNEMPPTVIRGVLMYLLQDIFHEHAIITDYWKAMDIASVCRLWSSHIPPLVYRFIFLQRKIQRVYSERQRRYVRHVTWSSNVRSILCQNKSLKAIGLRVVMDDNYTGPLQLINAITVFGLTSTPWNRFRRLQFFGKGILRAGTAAGLPDVVTDATNLDKFIVRNYALLEDFRLYPSPTTPGTDAADALDSLNRSGSFNFTVSPHYSILLSMRAESLKCLDCCQPAFLYLSSPKLLNLTTLELDVDCLRLNGHALRLNLPALETAKLINIRGEIPFGFARPYISGNPKQSNLKTLRLGFKNIPDSQQNNLVSITRPLYSYPNLSKLVISRSTGVYDDLYSIFRNAPLRLLQINENHRALARIDTDIIRNIDSLHLQTISPNSRDWWNDPTHLITRFYLAESVVRKAVLDICLPFPTQITWVNLVCMSFSTDVATGSNIVRLMEQLPLLKYLRISCLSMDPHNVDNYYWGSIDRQADIQDATTPTILDTIHVDNFENRSDFEAINTSVQIFGIRTPGYFDDEFLSRLPLVLPSLQKFAMDLEEADTLRASMVHLAPEVEVCDNEGIDQYFKLD